MKKFIASLVLSLAVAAPAFATRAVFEVVNDSVEPVVRIHVSPTYRSSYGTQDILGDRVISPGTKVTVDPGNYSDANNECELDIVAVGQNGSKWQKRMDVCSITSWRLVGGESASSKKIK